jgi:hypothetical protein
MKKNSRNGFNWSLFCACLTLLGCTTTNTSSLGGGYEEVDVRHHHTSEETSWRGELWYRYPSGKRVRVWRSVLDNVVVRGDVAIFTGGPASDLIVVQGGGPALMITKDVLRTVPELSEATSGSVARKRLVDDTLEVHLLLGPTRPSLVVKLTWEQLSAIMRNVKAHGVLHEDKKLGTLYLESP